MHTIILPSRLTEYALEQLMPLMNRADQENEILLDFKNVNFYFPTATVAILARCVYWNNMGKTIYVDNFNECPASSYLKRIDFFGELGLQLEEPFTRRPTNGRFVTIRRINRGKDVNDIAREVAECMARGADDVRRVLSYAIGEIITNVVQHSAGEGFLTAQRYKDSNTVHFAVADSGIGLRRSFDGTEIEHELTSPLIALKRSMEPGVSSALLRPPLPYQTTVNKGIGLSMVNELTRQTFGIMHVLTENAHFHRNGDISTIFNENNKISNQGVLVSVELNTDEIDNFQDIITNVRDVVTPIELDNWDSMFE